MYGNPSTFVLNMRQSSLKNTPVLGVIFLVVFTTQYQKGVMAACNQTFFDDQGAFTLTISSGEPACNAHVNGSNNSVVLLTFDIPNSPEEGTVSFTILDQWEENSSLLYSYSGGNMDPATVNLYSFSSDVLVALEGNGVPFDIDVSYIIEDRSSISTTLSNESGIIEVSGNTSNYINFQHTWHISAGKDNFLFFHIMNVTLNDTAGDFLAIGTGSKVFGEAPALMLTGEWRHFPTLHLNGTEGYINLLMKSYSPDLGVLLYYDNWQYTPPTLFPPITKPPLDVIDAYFYYDDGKDNYYDVVTNFTKYVKKYADEYCNRETSKSWNEDLPDWPLVLDVEVVQVVETSPCLIVEFYVDILNGTCLKDVSFSQADFGWLLGNYSKQLNRDFGRDVMLSCPMKLLWILAVALIVFVSLLVIVFVGCKSREEENLAFNNSEEFKEPMGHESGPTRHLLPTNPDRPGTHENIYQETDNTRPTTEYDDGSFCNDDDETDRESRPSSPNLPSVPEILEFNDPNFYEPGLASNLNTGQYSNYLERDGIELKELQLMIQGDLVENPSMINVLRNFPNAGIVHRQEVESGIYDNSTENPTYESVEHSLEDIHGQSTSYSQRL